MLLPAFTHLPPSNCVMTISFQYPVKKFHVALTEMYLAKGLEYLNSCLMRRISRMQFYLSKLSRLQMLQSHSMYK